MIIKYIKILSLSNLNVEMMMTQKNADAIHHRCIDLHMNVWRKVNDLRKSIPYKCRNPRSTVEGNQPLHIQILGS